jgi:phosphonoacetate hydrolase
VIVCIDGFDPSYLSHGLSHNYLPHLASFVSSGFATTAESAMPSFTNPNNVSIITGAPTSKHGISGNFFLDEVSGEERMVVDDELLKGKTILGELVKKGVKVAAVTAKDKLRRILGRGMDFRSGRSVCFSSEMAADCSVGENGIEDVERWLGRGAPGMYSGELSLFVLDAGVKLLEEGRAEVLYLTLSDFVQHHYAPEEKEAREFMAAVDARLGRLVELGAVVAVTGDHGMSDKCDEGGRVNVLFLEDVLGEKYPAAKARVICPITDPFVRHHGALGSFVRVHLRGDKAQLEEMMGFCRGLEHVGLVLGAEEACEMFEMPIDREGDFVVVSEKNAVVGSRREEHDLSNLAGHRLRSHGGVSEQQIPLILSVPLRRKAVGHRWRNFDAFDIALNFDAE